MAQARSNKLSPHRSAAGFSYTGENEKERGRRERVQRTERGLSLKRL